MHASALERRHRCIFGRQRPSAKVPGADRLPLFMLSPGEAPVLISPRPDGSRGSPQSMWLSPTQTTGACSGPGEPCRVRTVPSSSFRGRDHSVDADALLLSEHDRGPGPEFVPSTRCFLEATCHGAKRISVRALFGEKQRATSRTPSRLSGFRVCDTTARKHLAGDPVCLKRLLCRYAVVPRPGQYAGSDVGWGGLLTDRRSCSVLRPPQQLPPAGQKSGRTVRAGPTCSRSVSVGRSFSHHVRKS